MEVDNGDEQPKVLVAEALQTTPLSDLSIVELESLYNILSMAKMDFNCHNARKKVLEEVKKRYNLY